MIDSNTNSKSQSEIRTNNIASPSLAGLQPGARDIAKPGLSQIIGQTPANGLSVSFIADIQIVSDVTPNALNNATIMAVAGIHFCQDVGVV